MDKVILRFFILAVSGFAFVQSAHSEQNASSSLGSCNKLAVFELRQCLAQHGAHDNNHCWTDSHLAYQECHFAMTNKPSDRQLDEMVSKAELKKVQQVSRKVRPKTIKVLLMGAANVEVYQTVVLQTAEHLNLLIQMKGVSDKQRSQSAAREVFFTKLYDATKARVSCAQIKSQMEDFAEQHTDQYSRSAYREIKTLLPTYCRLLQG